jgi:uncharacterized membrane protein
MNFIGRLHPLLVHFPIAILLLAFLFELLAKSQRFNHLKPSIIPLLFLGSLSAVLSSISGYFLSQEGGYEANTVFYHQWGGIFTTLIALLFLGLKIYFSSLSAVWSMGVFTILSVLLTITGHYGANLTHGPEFLTEFAPWKVNPANEKFTLATIDNLDEAVFYTQMIQPIFEYKCYACHSAKKQKGDLRMDSPELLLKGGKNGKIIENLADSCALYQRIILPIEDKEHMPPREKDQLSSAEIGLIQAWLTSGASFDKKVSALPNAAKIKSYWQTLVQNQAKEDELPKEKVNPADEKVLLILKKAGIVALPVAAESHYLSLNFLNIKQIDKSVLENLDKIKSQIIYLKIENRHLKNEELAFINQCSQLRRLHLIKVNLTDNQIDKLLNLSELRFLNLKENPLTEKGLAKLAQLKKLKQLYLYQTNFTPNVIKSLHQKNTRLNIDTGTYRLPKIAADTIVYKREK